MCGKLSCPVHVVASQNIAVCLLLSFVLATKTTVDVKSTHAFDVKNNFLVPELAATTIFSAAPGGSSLELAMAANILSTEWQPSVNETAEIIKNSKNKTPCEEIMTDVAEILILGPDDNASCSANSTWDVKEIVPGRLENITAIACDQFKNKVSFLELNVRVVKEIKKNAFRTVRSVF